MRFRPALVVLPLLVLLAGCAPEPATSPTPTPSATTPAPTPTPTPTATTTPDPSQPGAKFTTAQLVTLCTDRTRALAPDATYLADMATTEWLADSLWFVVIPKTLGDQDTVAVCAIGGTPDAPTFELEGESLPSGVAEIRDELLAGNTGGGE